MLNLFLNVVSYYVMITKIQHSACSILLFVFISANLLHSGLHLHLFFEHDSEHVHLHSHNATSTTNTNAEFDAQKEHTHISQSASFVARVPNNFPSTSIVALHHFHVTNSFITNQTLSDFFFVLNPPPLLLHLLDGKSHIHSGISPPIA